MYMYMYACKFSVSFFSLHQQSMIDHIKAIRDSGKKVIVAHFFDCDKEDDSCTREACMIKAIGEFGQ